MSNATNLALLGLSGFGNAGNVLTSTGETTAPAFSASGVGVKEIRVVNQVLSRLGVNKSTGNVSVSGLPDISELDVPSWVNAGHISDWSTLQYYMSAVAATNTSPASALSWEYFGSFPATGNIDGGVLHPNGKIYCNVTNSGLANWSIMRVIDPNTNTVSTFNAAGQGSIAFGSSSAPVVAPNGRIFFVPYNRTFCMYFDPSTNTFSTFAGFNAGAGNSSLMNGGVLAPNGKIYFAPFNDTVFRFLDPDALTINAYATITGNTPSSHYYGAVLAPNGKIYFVPSYTSLFRVVDPSTNTVQVIGTITGSTNDNNYAGGVLHPNGKIYIIPGNNSVLRIIDPATDTVTAVATYSDAALTGGWDGAVVHPNGKIYPAASNYLFAYIDPDTYALVTLNAIRPVSYDSYHNGGKGIIAPNGKMYLMPFNNTQALALTIPTNNNFNLNVCTNPMFK
jgi:streptogramin lyase